MRLKALVPLAEARGQAVTNRRGAAAAGNGVEDARRGSKRLSMRMGFGSADPRWVVIVPPANRMREAG